MADIMDYLDWRGDLTLQQSPFNEVDHLILAQLAYVNFDGIIPGVASNEVVTLEVASKLFFKINDEEEVLRQKLFARLAPFVMKKMASTRRFRNMKLCKYVSQLDYEIQKQFGVFQVFLEDGTIYVAFRGTDDTLVGWREDFNMSFMAPIPAQVEAVHYVNHTLSHTTRLIRMGGHSKGGNLAIYAALKCQECIRKQIIEVYNNDGPGFNKEMMASFNDEPIMSKIRTIVPQGSIIGMLLEHEQTYTVVKSKQVGILQHDAMSWEVMGPKFIYLEELSKGSQLLEHALKGWMEHLEDEERSQFVDILFSILEETGAKTVLELTKAKLKKANRLIKSYRAMDDVTKKMLRHTIKLLTNEYCKVVKQSLGKKISRLNKF